MRTPDWDRGCRLCEDNQGGGACLVFVWNNIFWIFGSILSLSLFLKIEHNYGLFYLQQGHTPSECSGVKGLRAVSILPDILALSVYFRSTNTTGRTRNHYTLSDLEITCFSFLLQWFLVTYSCRYCKLVKVMFSLTASLGKLASPSQQCLKDSTIPSQCVSESLSFKGPCLSLSMCAAVSQSPSLSLSVCATELAVSEAATGGDARRLSPSGCHLRRLLPPMYAPWKVLSRLNSFFAPWGHAGTFVHTQKF